MCVRNSIGECKTDSRQGECGEGRGGEAAKDEQTVKTNSISCFLYLLIYLHTHTHTHTQARTVVVVD